MATMHSRLPSFSRPRKMMNADMQPLFRSAHPVCTCSKTRSSRWHLPSTCTSMRLRQQSLAGYSGTGDQWKSAAKRQTASRLSMTTPITRPEIRATLAALRGAYPDHRLVTVFQPHTHDRTLRLWTNLPPLSKIPMCFFWPAFTTPVRTPKKPDRSRHARKRNAASNCPVITPQRSVKQTLLRTSILQTE